MEETTQRQSLLSSLIVMVSTFGSRLLGFLRIALISAIIGGGAQVDVLNWAFAIPNNFRKLLAEGALSAAFIPEISKLLIHDKSGKDAHKLVRSLLGMLLILVIP
ncbi:MAG: murein biosynthesis integral membrane protein MurJ, partial [Spirochaetaceae bacterium]|nr:murein biosynthesis integral membrane protein MurJ [Spirochaetaceae bacterium]